MTYHTSPSRSDRKINILAVLAALVLANVVCPPVYAYADSYKLATGGNDISVSRDLKGGSSSGGGPGGGGNGGGGAVGGPKPQGPPPSGGHHSSKKPGKGKRSRGRRVLTIGES